MMKAKSKPGLKTLRNPSLQVCGSVLFLDCIAIFK